MNCICFPVQICLVLSVVALSPPLCVDSDKQAVLTVAQDWVPILDKVFGQKWCSDLWQIKELASGKGGEERTGGSGLGIVGSFPSLNALIRENLEPSPTSPLQDPQWMPLEDMEVLSSTLDTPQDPPATISTTGEHGNY